jgi:hypothetical protein
MPLRYCWARPWPGSRLAELASVSVTEAQMEPGEVAGLLTFRRATNLISTAAALAHYVKRDLEQVIGEGGEDRMFWASDYHLSGEYLHKDPDWRLRGDRSRQECSA